MGTFHSFHEVSLLRGGTQSFVAGLHRELEWMRRGGFDSIKKLLVLEKAAWQRGYGERATSSVKLRQVATTKSCNVGKCLEDRVMATNEDFITF